MSPPNSCVPISTREEVALVTILLNAVILAALAAAGAEPTFSWIGRKIARLVLNCEGRSFIAFPERRAIPFLTSFYGNGGRKFPTQLNCDCP
jgi:hypothetical protein